MLNWEDFPVPFWKVEMKRLDILKSAVSAFTAFCMGETATTSHLSSVLVDFTVLGSGREMTAGASLECR